MKKIDPYCNQIQIFWSYIQVHTIFVLSDLFMQPPNILGSKESSTCILLFSLHENSLSRQRWFPLVPLYRLEISLQEAMAVFLNRTLLIINRNYNGLHKVVRTVIFTLRSVPQGKEKGQDNGRGLPSNRYQEIEAYQHRGSEVFVRHKHLWSEGCWNIVWLTLNHHKLLTCIS